MMSGCSISSFPSRGGRKQRLGCVYLVPANSHTSGEINSSSQRQRQRQRHHHQEVQNVAPPERTTTSAGPCSATTDSAAAETAAAWVAGPSDTPYTSNATDTPYTSSVSVAGPSVATARGSYRNKNEAKYQLSSRLLTLSTIISTQDCACCRFVNSTGVQLAHTPLLRWLTQRLVSAPRRVERQERGTVRTRCPLC